MNRNIISMFLILMLSLLTACKVSKDIATPEAPLPTTFRNDVPAEARSIAATGWKRFVAEPSLQKLISDAITNNYDMQLALKNIEAAQLVLKQTRLAYLPDARLQVGATTNRPSDNSLNGLSAKSFLGTTHVEDYSANITLTWEADIWGKIRNRKAGALAAYLQTEEAKKWIQTNLVATIAEEYFNLLMLDAQLAVAKSNIALNDSTIKMIRLRYEAGQVTALAIQQAEAQQLTAAALVPQLERNIGITENALSILTGSLPASIQRTIALNQFRFPDNLPTGIPADLLSSRPDVKSFELELITANARVGIAKANMYPTLSITAGGGINALKASNWFNVPASLFGIAAGSVIQPLLQKKELKTAYEIAKVEREKTVIRFRQAVLSAVGEVSDALVSIEQLQTEQGIAVNRVNTLQKAITSANLLFSTGMANYLEVITAQSNALQSELELAAVIRAQLGAKVQLYRALGGGWK